MLQNGSDHILQMEETEINIKGSGNNNPVYETAKETLIQSLAREDSLEKGMATYSCILAWRIPWTEEPGRLHFMGSQRSGRD